MGDGTHLSSYFTSWLLCSISELLLPSGTSFSGFRFPEVLLNQTNPNPCSVLRYGEKSWLTKRECQSITQLFCNLSQETENFTEHFYGRVRARGCSPSWVRSERFEPRKESKYQCSPKSPSCHLQDSFSSQFSPARLCAWQGGSEGLVFWARR